MTTATEKPDLGMKLIQFYKEFIIGSSTAIKTLADIQEEYPEEYRIIEEMKEDPTLIEEITDKLTEEQKDLLLTIMLKSSIIGKKTQRLFESTPKEKRDLAKELENFLAIIEVKMNEIIQTKKVMKSE